MGRGGVIVYFMHKSRHILCYFSFFIIVQAVLLQSTSASLPTILLTILSLSSHKAAAKFRSCPCADSPPSFPCGA